MLKYGAKGAAVTTLQENLIKLGRGLPRFGADGQLGSETLNAVARLLADHDRSDPDIKTVSDKEVSFIADLAAKLPVPVPARLVDLRERSKRDIDRGPRPWTKVTGACLHQTACVFANRPERIREIGAHFMIMEDGTIYWLHDLNRLVWHGNGWNAGTFGIEINGTYEGIQGNPKTLWNPGDNRKPMRLTDAACESTKDVIRFCKELIEFRGGMFKYVVAHRQASGDRRSDPGSEIWQRVGMAMNQELGTTDGGPDFVLGDGLPIPEQWDPSRKGRHY